jgi:osmoprotectant transport system ATP-binding protein
MLTLKDVSKSFDRIQAVRAIELAVQEGRTTVLIGPSGCGKSTILRLVIGLIAPDSGSISFRNEVITRDSIPRLRRRMGYVIQDGGLFPHMTARGNITLMASFLNWSRSRIDARLEELIALTQFPGDGLARYPVQLSGGQKQRVSLMRALMLDPELLLLDEPLGALDPLIRVDVQAELRAIFRTLGKTVLIVTHDLGEAAYLGDVIVLMRDGEIVQEGSVEELYETPGDPFVTRFINAQRGPLGNRHGERR